MGEAAVSGGSGVRGDGLTDDTRAVQALLDTTSTVVLPGGTYRCSTLHLRSGTTLVLEPDATLVAHPDDDTFTRGHVRTHGYQSFADEETADFDHALLSGVDLTGVVVTGGGTIDGNRDRRGGPKPIALLGCRDVRVDGVSIVGAANYAVSLGDCDDVRVENAEIRAAHADGIDPDACRSVIVRNCTVESDDDAICLKTSLLRHGVPLAAEDVTIERCRVRSASNGFKIGTETNGDVRRVSVRDLEIDGRPRAGRDEHFARAIGVDEGGGITIETVDGGTVEDVTVEQVVCHETVAPVFVRRGTRGRGQLESRPGALRRVVVRDLDAVARHGAREIVAGFHVRDFASALLGVAGFPVGDVTLVDVRLTTPGGLPSHFDWSVPERDDAYPQCTMLGPLPASGLFARHVERLVLDGVVFATCAPDCRELLVCEDVRGLVARSS
jgi:polygalacturonase